MTRTVFLIAALAVAAAPLSAQGGHGQANMDDAAAVERASLDYLEGFYEGDAEKLRRSVRPEVTKYGFWRESADQDYSGTAMSFDQMIAFADRVRETGDTAAADAPKEVIILDVQDQTATTKVVAWWGTDYLQLAKYEGRWQIIHVIWQSPQEMGHADNG
jgi:hypothetical protein